MLYETLAQPYIFLIIIISGFLTGIFFDFLNFIKNVIKIKFFYNFLLFFFVFLTIFVFYYINLNYNYGEIRVYTLLSFLLAFMIERLLIGNFVAHLFEKCYNVFKDKREDKSESKSKKKRIKRVYRREKRK